MYLFLTLSANYCIVCLLTMKTSKPLSTISYNTEKFLVSKLNDLVKAKKITCWFAIYHQPEEKEKKAHWHLYLEPNVSISTMDLDDEFIQYVKGCMKKPLKCIDWKPSKFPEWYLYSKHDIDYISQRLEIKKYHYSIDDFITSDRDLLEQRDFEVYHESDIFRDNRFLNYLRNGGSVTNLARSGFITPSKAFQYLSFSRLYSGETNVIPQKWDGVIEETDKE